MDVVSHYLPVPHSLAGQGSSIATSHGLLGLRQTHELLRATHCNAEQRRACIAALGHRSALFHVLDGELTTRRTDLLEAVAASAIRALAPESDTSVRHDEIKLAKDNRSRQPMACGTTIVTMDAPGVRSGYQR